MAQSAQDIETPLPSDKERPDLYGLLIFGLLVIVLVTVLAGFVLSWKGKVAPDNMWAIGLVCAGALAGMLAPRPAA